MFVRGPLKTFGDDVRRMSLLENRPKRGIKKYMTLFPILYNERATLLFYNAFILKMNRPLWLKGNITFVLYKRYLSKVKKIIDLHRCCKIQSLFRDFQCQLN